jgi:hypothetical protein
MQTFALPSLLHMRESIKWRRKYFHALLPILECVSVGVCSPSRWLSIWSCDLNKLITIDFSVVVNESSWVENEPEMVIFYSTHQRKKEFWFYDEQLITKPNNWPQQKCKQNILAYVGDQFEFCFCCLLHKIVLLLGQLHSSQALSNRIAKNKTLCTQFQSCSGSQWIKIALEK